MELLLVALIVAGLVGWFAARRTARPAVPHQPDATLTTSLRAAEEDVTRFGEELRRLDADVAGHPLDEAMRQDYGRALDAYADAKESLAAVRAPDDVRHVTAILEDGRHLVACVQARVAGRPLPTRRPPCFFDPAHGPSTENVDWAPSHGATRSVPACAADARRVLAGADPHARTVLVGSRRVPYWEAGRDYAPWAEGYYGGWRGSSLIRDIAIGSLVFHGLAGLPHLLGGVGDGMADIGAGLGDGLGHGLGDLLGGIGDLFD